MLRSVSDALEGIASPLHQLRVQFHLELAKAEVDSDFLAKVHFRFSAIANHACVLLQQASADLDKAALLDYTVAPAADSEQTETKSRKDVRCTLH